ncbi:MAG: hypothetical protein LPJ96_05155 [Exiguobacterium sp.]|uniref:Uncharacterized protein n=1 Tax=Exiguobacterium alkaliphilum TaxID=1428684 RepID=A0ABT2L0T5_9BACL|nr:MULTISPECIES: hypothetical protein [Exiguobacterium]MDX5322975.1 hypothetical protein [Exiguobacterium sp.]KDN57178.1 hypothetical protein DI14_01330 [Exiguobacterium sp. AB2]MCT4796743.1 hypothetical protein [Exiguobacterium alkaliphilum]MDX5424735.1 hypothetical protein [Exiguobacterium sp.]MDX6772210.1 hypothetical protein [Exiguobacterium sp.]
MTKWTREQLNPEMKHPLEQLVGVVGMLAILRYGYLFIDTDKSRTEILIWLVVGFAVIYVVEKAFKKAARYLPIVRKRFLIPVYVLLLALFLASFRVPRETVEAVRQFFGI